MIINKYAEIREAMDKGGILWLNSGGLAVRPVL